MSILHTSTKVITPPPITAVTLAEMKLYLRMDTTAEDSEISDMLADAQSVVEDQTARTGINTQYRFMMDRFPLTPGLEYLVGMPALPIPPATNRWPLDPSAWAIYLPRAPVVSVDLFQYTDTTQTLTTWDLSNLQIDLDSEPARLTPFQGSAWPSVQFGPGAVQILFTAGYSATDPTLVDRKLRRAIKMLVAHWYMNREGAAPYDVREVPMAVASCVELAKVPWIV